MKTLSEVHMVFYYIYPINATYKTSFPFTELMIEYD